MKNSKINDLIIDFSLLCRKEGYLVLAVDVFNENGIIRCESQLLNDLINLNKSSKDKLYDIGKLLEEYIENCDESNC